MSIQINKLVLATRNLDKVTEIKRVLWDLDFDIVSVVEIANVPEVEEDGETIKSNAVKKAQVVSQATGLPALADDTALEVDFLRGAPGVYSSRFAGEKASYSENVQLLLTKLAGVLPAQRTARFRCVMALVYDGHYQTVEGQCKGLIIEEPRGKNGFGYDPVFYVPEYGQTFAEMPLDLKNKISHRGKALRKVRELFERI